jgi:hypothetical protein
MRGSVSECTPFQMAVRQGLVGLFLWEKSAGLELEPERAAFGRVYYAELGPRAERYERQEKL